MAFDTTPCKFVTRVCRCIVPIHKVHTKLLFAVIECMPYLSVFCMRFVFEPLYGHIYICFILLNVCLFIVSANMSLGKNNVFNRPIQLDASVVKANGSSCVHVRKASLEIMHALRNTATSLTQ